MSRAAKPRDKAKVEVGVQVVERWMLARLRHHTFFALVEVNAALAPLLSSLNTRPFKKLPGSRQELFDTLDRPALPGLIFFAALAAVAFVRSRLHLWIEAAPRTLSTNMCSPHGKK